jgi:CheY-like chemotaxis protein
VKIEPLHILLADDDEADRMLFSEAFKELEIKINLQTVNDGTQLMKYLAVKDQLLPDFLFLDLNMPRKSGIECLKEIRSKAGFKDISIAIYSTSASDRYVDEAFSIGATVYILKPNTFKRTQTSIKKSDTSNSYTS